MIDVDAICEDLKTKMSEDSIKWLKEMKEEELISTHHSLGRFIRNTYKLWECQWEPDLVDGVDHSPYHPDAISMTIIKIFHKKLNESG